MSIVDWVADIVGITAPSTLEILFMMCAFVGTAFFLILMALMMLGDILGGVFDSVFDYLVALYAVYAPQAAQAGCAALPALYALDAE